MTQEIFTKDIEAMGCVIEPLLGFGNNAYFRAANSKGDVFWSYYFDKSGRAQSYGRTWTKGFGPCQNW